MRTVSDIIRELTVTRTAGPLQRTVGEICLDSRHVTPGCLFAALRGTLTDGHRFIDSATAQGAAAILCETLPDTLVPAVTYVVVPDTAAALGRVSAEFFDNPSRRLILVGVTGTNGKTTIATLLYETFRALGYSCGLLSTVVNYIDDEALETTHTTPDAVSIQRLMARMVQAGCRYCFMEVSSHSIAQERIAGLHFSGGIFSNLTQDHLDFHKTFAEYLKIKKRFFDRLPGGAFVLTNKDDRNGMVMAQNTPAAVHTYALQANADFHAKVLEKHLGGMQLSIDGREVWVQFIGDFNASNLLAVYGAAVLLGAPAEEVLRILSSLTPVAGRFQYLTSADGVTVIIDYAHTPDAVENVLRAIRQIARDPQQGIITVIGCGGDRDRTKRPKMAGIAAAGSTTLILTSDNPRSENPEAILDDMQAGLSGESLRNTLRITDRRQAIRTACRLARAGDIVLIAGKGHENYQITGKVKSHFDDKEEAEQAILTRSSQN